MLSDARSASGHEVRRVFDARPASSNESVVEVSVEFRISLNGLGGYDTFDFNFLNTPYFDAVLPDGVTADLGLFANRTFVEPPPNGVPEPATLALLGLGLAGRVASRRRKS